MKKKSNQKTSSRKKKGKKKNYFFRRLLFKAFLLVFTLSLAGLGYLDYTVRDRFEGKRWKLPAQVYARPLELYAGLQLSPNDLINELKLLGYQELPDPTEPGSYCWRNHSIDITTRAFNFGSGLRPGLAITLTFSGNKVDKILQRDTATTLPIQRLDPALIGGIYPEKNEDRILIQLEEVPTTVTDALITVEDRRFYTHHGIDLLGISRAIINMASGGPIQGGSTITQQLVKNFYLTSERTIQRKVIEIVMALLLEAHYSKDEILETYLNEVYLGQDGNRAIHGFGLASHFYFNKTVSQLDLHEAALLVGLLKGPSYYNPRTRSQRAKQRRDLVLKEMEEAGQISWSELQMAQKRPLGVLNRPVRGTTSFPAFMDLLQDQLHQDYRDEDLRSKGLKIFTSLDPLVQKTAEKTLQQRLNKLEHDRQLEKNCLQGAVIITSSQNAEIQAVVGGRDPRFEGFNRALNAKRPIGSLIKPVIYLNALSHSQRYTLATLLDDSPLMVKQTGSADWVPDNFDKQSHGQVLLHDALMNSYNLSTVRLGLELGPDAAIEQLKRLGLNRNIPAYPASLLGANTLTPLEITQIYQTIASGGFRTPLKAIREILDHNGEPLQRYPLAVQQTINDDAIYLLTTTLQDVVTQGTGKNMQNFLSTDLGVAGKTGTTDDFRDSWFAGFTENSVGVVWIGRDDNQPTGLTGASGAMTVWGETMAQLNPQPLILAEPDRIEYHWIDRPTGKLSGSGCKDAVYLPFIAGTAPTEQSGCGPESRPSSLGNWFKRIFQ